LIWLHPRRSVTSQRLTNAILCAAVAQSFSTGCDEVFYIAADTGLAVHLEQSMSMARSASAKLDFSLDLAIHTFNAGTPHVDSLSSRERIAPRSIEDRSSSCPELSFCNDSYEVRVGQHGSHTEN
jgi:uncharacterized protein YfiM (DUF2279 family)